MESLDLRKPFRRYGDEATGSVKDCDIQDRCFETFGIVFPWCNERQCTGLHWLLSRVRRKTSEPLVGGRGANNGLPISELYRVLARQ